MWNWLIVLNIIRSWIIFDIILRERNRPYTWVLQVPFRALPGNPTWWLIQPRITPEDRNLHLSIYPRFLPGQDFGSCSAKELRIRSWTEYRFGQSTSSTKTKSTKIIPLNGPQILGWIGRNSLYSLFIEPQRICWCSTCGNCATNVETMLKSWNKTTE